MDITKFVKLSLGRWIAGALKFEKRENFADEIPIVVAFN
jgi:hypothetical protein